MWIQSVRICVVLQRSPLSVAVLFSVVVELCRFPSAVPMVWDQSSGSHGSAHSCEALPTGEARGSGRNVSMVPVAWGGQQSQRSVFLPVMGLWYRERFRLTLCSRVLSMMFFFSLLKQVLYASCDAAKSGAVVLPSGNIILSIFTSTRLL